MKVWVHKETGKKVTLKDNQKMIDGWEIEVPKPKRTYTRKNTVKKSPAKKPVTKD